MTLYWLLNPSAAAEFQAAQRALRDSGEVRVAPDWQTCRRLAAAGELPDALIVCESRPGETSAAEVEGLRSAAPLLPIIAVCGSWCEGGLRSSKPWPAAWRLYAHQSERLAREAARQARGETPAWCLPATLTEDERLLERGDRGSGVGELRRVAVVAARERASRELMVAMCHARGLETILWTEPDGSVAGDVIGRVALGVWDAAAGWEVDRDAVARFTAALSPAPVVVLTGFPRVEHAVSAAACGVRLVVSKPLVIDDVWAALGDIAPADMTSTGR